MAAIIAATPDIIKPYSTFDFPSLPSWHRGRMVLVGDAAHAASPSSGQGASMAIEDAVTLGRILRGATAGNDSGENITARFERYEAERRLVGLNSAHKYVPYRPDALRGVILGCTTDDSTRDTLYALIGERHDASLPGIVVYRARKDLVRDQLRIVREPGAPVYSR